MQVIELMLKIGCGFDCVLVEWGREVLNRGVGVRDVGVRDGGSGESRAEAKLSEEIGEEGRSEGDGDGRWSRSQSSSLPRDRSGK